MDLTQERWGTGLAVESSLLTELRSTFVTEARGCLEALERARHDTARALHAAHALQGAAAVCDYQEIREVAAVVEARLANMVAADRSSEALVGEIAGLVRYLKRAVEARKAGAALAPVPGISTPTDEP